MRNEARLLGCRHQNDVKRISAIIEVKWTEERLSRTKWLSNDDEERKRKDELAITTTRI